MAQQSFDLFCYLLATWLVLSVTVYYSVCWESRSLGVTGRGSRGAWESRSLRVTEPGSPEAWESRSLLLQCPTFLSSTRASCHMHFTIKTSFLTSNLYLIQRNETILSLNDFTDLHVSFMFYLHSTVTDAGWLQFLKTRRMLTRRCWRVPSRCWEVFYHLTHILYICSPKMLKFNFVSNPILRYYVTLRYQETTEGNPTPSYFFLGNYIGWRNDVQSRTVPSPNNNITAGICSDQFYLPHPVLSMIMNYTLKSLTDHWKENYFICSHREY